MLKCAIKQLISRILVIAIVAGTLPVQALEVEDIDSKEMLELALEDYNGTVFFISHDRYFIDKIATRIIELTPDDITSYIGNYSDFQEKKQQLALIEAQKQEAIANQNTTATVNDYQKQKEQRRLEQQRKRQLEETETLIATYEERLAYLQAELFKEEVYLDHQKSIEVQTEIETLEEQLTDAMELWETLV